MADLNKSLNITIKSIFDSTGFKQLLSGIKRVRTTSKPMEMGFTKQALSQMDLGGKQIKEITSDFKLLSTQSEQFGALSDKASQLTGNFKQLQAVGVGTEQFKQANVWLGKYGASLNEVGILTELSNKKMKATPLTLKRVSSAIADPVQGFKTFQGVMNQVNAGNMVTREQFKLFRKEISALGGTVKETRSGFAMYALGIMFGGMQIMRTFQRIMTAGVGTFMRLTEGQGEAAMGITALAANFTLLKFAIGDAIATAILPLMPMIVNIIRVVGDWISQHRKLTAWIVIGGFILGAFFMIIGQGWLFFQALGSVISKVKLVLMGFTKGVAVLGKVIFPIMGKWIMWLVNTAIPALGKAFVWLALKGITAMKTLAIFMVTNPIGLAILTLIAILGFFLVKWKGNWKAALANIILVSLQISKFIVKWVSKTGLAIVGGFDVAWAGVRQGFASFGNWMIDKWNTLIDKISKAKITVGFGRFKKTFSLAGVAEAKITDFRFDTGQIGRSLDRFKEVQSAMDQVMDEAFGGKIDAWQEVLDAWSDVIQEEEGLGLPDMELESLDIKELELDLQNSLNDLESDSLEMLDLKLENEKELNLELEKRIEFMKSINEASRTGNIGLMEKEFARYKARSSSATI